jgi:hypothetical protein
MQRRHLLAASCFWTDFSSACSRRSSSIAPSAAFKGCGARSVWLCSVLFCVPFVVLGSPVSEETMHAQMETSGPFRLHSGADCWVHLPKDTCPRHGAKETEASQQWSPTSSSSSRSKHAEHPPCLYCRAQLELLRTRAMLADLHSHIAQLEYSVAAQHDGVATQHYTGAQSLARPGLMLPQTPTVPRAGVHDRRADELAAIYGSSKRRSRSAQRDGSLLRHSNTPLDAESGWMPFTPTARDLYCTPVSGRSSRRIGSPIGSRPVERARPLWAVYDRNWALHLR